MWKECIRVSSQETKITWHAQAEMSNKDLCYSIVPSQIRLKNYSDSRKREDK